MNCEYTDIVRTRCTHCVPPACPTRMRRLLRHLQISRPRLTPRQILWRFAKRYPKAILASGNGGNVTEMDALVAYLQVLGTMVNFADTSEESLKQ